MSRRVDPGRAAYEAFTKELAAHVLLGGEREGPWEKLPTKAQTAWRRAAEVAVDTHLENILDAEKRRAP